MINREPPEHRDDLLARAFPYRLTGVSEKTAVAVADWLTRDDPASVGGYGSSFALTRDVAVGDGRTLWLCYAANWTGHKQNPKGSVYAMCLHEIKLVNAQ